MPHIIRSPFFLSRFALLLLAFIGYGLTMARTVSFWDCGEFISAAHVLGIPHPPGTPFFVLLGRVWDVLFGWVGGTALAINMLSAVSSALCALLVLEITVKIVKKWQLSNGVKAVLGFLAGSLTLFSDTFWFNAVEAEVYGFSMFLLLLGVWTLLRWDEEGAQRRDRWLVLFVYLSFLGTGVHTYSMMTLPAAWLFVGARSGRWLPGRATVAAVVVAVLGLGYFLLFPWNFGLTFPLLIFALLGLGTLAWGAWRGEWNDPLFWALGLFFMMSIFLVQPFLFGLAFLVPALALVWGVLRLRRRHSAGFGLALALLLAAGVGYSVQLYLPLRSLTNPVLDENNPENWESLLASLERKQYGSMGMLERAFYRRGEAQSQLGFFPRIGYLGYHLNQFMDAPLGAQKPGLPQKYWREGNVEELGQAVHRLVWELLLVAVLVAVWARRKHPQVLLLAGLFGLGSLGLIFYVNFADGSRPDSSWAANWYQRMAVLRADVPDDLPALPELPLLNETIETYRYVPPSLRENWLRTPAGAPLNVLMQWNAALAKVGKSIPMPPGPVHLEVRERDYFYTPALLFYTVLVALALGHLLTLWKNAYWQRVAIFLACLAWLLPFVSHFERHNRSRDWTAWEFAYNILSSVPQGGILFTYGDNDTFPVWYLQMVEKVRTDVVVVNTSLANMDWYRAEILRSYPHLRLGDLHPDSIAPMAYRTMLAPTVNFHDTVFRLSVTPTWRPSEEQLFSSALIANNWPTTPVCFMYSADPEDLGELHGHLPITGMVRQLGVGASMADSLLLHHLTRVYRFSNLQQGDWRYQEGSRSAVAGYRWLVSSALEKGLAQPGSPEEKILRELAGRIEK
jgi:hypothetical protein